MRYKNIAGRFFGLVTKHACDTRTDGQNYDSQDRAGIAASRGKNAGPNSEDGFVGVNNAGLGDDGRSSGNAWNKSSVAFRLHYR